MTAHDDFKELDLDRIYEIMEKGFVYRGIGKGK
jgi:hypothetical protein